MDLYGYGEELLSKEQAAITSYGHVCRKDHQPMEAYVEQLEQADQTGLEPGMTL